jgi:hypothetical protein
MFRHVALFTWTPEATGEQREAVTTGLSALPGLIGTVRDYRVGPDAGLAEGNFDFAVVADFDDAAGFVAYRDHPAHQAVLAERIRPILASRAAVQYEIG